ncbi:MAG: hypothetical protein OXI33_01195 [Chloroflexota bacterium]|nr:hypothetical protein [Chloroflexota bacterium]
MRNCEHRARKARSDVTQALGAFLAGIAFAIQDLEDSAGEEMSHRFATVLKAAGEQASSHLHDDARAQYLKIRQYLNEHIEIAGA